MDNFYEGKYIFTQPHSLGVILLMPFYQRLKRQKLFSRFLNKAKNQKILDLGCGGGNSLFGKRGEVHGLDISYESLKKARKIYKATVLASSTHIPYPAGSFDQVVSADLIGHLREPDKKQTLREIRRVLKPAGKTLHYIEVDSQNPFEKFAKRSPDLYQKYFIEQDGHFGLEPIEKIAGIFKGANFKITKIIPVYKLTFNTDEFIKRFDNEYKTKSLIIKTSVKISRAINIFKPVKLATNLIGGLLFDFIGLFLPRSFSGGVFIAAEKEN